MFVHRRVDVKFFLIEVTECEYFTLGADDIRPAEFLSGTGGEFTSDHIFVCPVITFHDDTIDGCLRSLVDPNFDIDRILDDSNFYRLRRKKQDRKSTRLNSSHVAISYAVFCLKKKKINILLLHNREHMNKHI